MSIVFLCLKTTLTVGDTTNTRDIVIDQVLKISAEDAFSYWVTPKRLESWLTTKANVEARLGGAYELFWNPETPNENSTIGCKITAFVPGRLLAFEWKGAVPFADLMNVMPLPTWASVSFEKLSPTETAIHFRHTDWSTGKRWAEARTWQESSWLGAFEQLQKSLSR